MDENRNCIDCKFFTYTPGERGFYPGEGCCPDIGCQKQVWRLDFEDDQEAFVRCLKTAQECELFQSISPQPTE